jgi:hypothetical protein
MPGGAVTNDWCVTNKATVCNTILWLDIITWATLATRLYVAYVGSKATWVSLCMMIFCYN